MNADTLILYVREKHPEIDNLSERTWTEIADAMMRLFDAEWKPEDAMALVFKAISGQLRHDISDGLRRAMDKNGCSTACNTEV